MLYLCSVMFGNKVFPLKDHVNRGRGEPRALQNSCTLIPLLAAALLVSGVFIICGLTVGETNRYRTELHGLNCFDQVTLIDRRTYSS